MVSGLNNAGFKWKRRGAARSSSIKVFGISLSWADGPCYYLERLIADDRSLELKVGLGDEGEAGFITGSFDLR